MTLIKSALKATTASDLGSHTPQSYFQNLMVLRGSIWVVDGIQLQYARRVGIITAIPAVTDDQIMDRSKGDWVTKALAILQSLGCGSNSSSARPNASPPPSSKS